MRPPRDLDLPILALLVATLVALLTIWGSGRHSLVELREEARSAVPQRRVWALHQLVNRGSSPRFDGRDLRQLLRSEERLVRDFALTSGPRRLAGKGIQERYLARQELGSRDRRRGELLHRGRLTQPAFHELMRLLALEERAARLREDG